MDANTISPSVAQDDFLWAQIKELPYFRGLLRAVEAREYQTLDLPAPTLDLGCGDGHFASATFSRRLEVGIDPWRGPVRLAQQSGAYEQVIRGIGNQMPFPLEHIPNLDEVLMETARVLQPGAPFIFCVPNHQFLANLSVSNFFDRVGLKAVGDAYRAFFNRISRHHHCDSPQVWQERLERAGFRVERWWHYFSPAALHTLEWGHYFGLPSLVAHFLFRRWILAPTRWNLALTQKLVQPYYNEIPRQEMGAYSFYIARRVE